MKKHTLGIILPAIALLGAAGSASAAIDADFGNGVGIGDGDGGGELFLSVVDRSSPEQRSYILDLGITAAQFLASDSPSFSLSFAADANLLNLLNNRAGTLSWNVAANHNTWDGGNNPDALGFLTTSTDALNPFNVNAGFNGLSNAIGTISTYLNSVNGTSTDYAANTSLIIPANANAFYDTGWGGSWHGAPFNTETTLDGSLNFYFVALDFTNDPTTNTSRAQQLLGQWSLSSAGLLTYGVASAAVPLPAGVWLLGSALLGMFGIGRRRKAGELVAA